MVEIDITHPAFSVRGQAASGGGKMDMKIAFEIASESVDGRISAREEILFFGKFNDNISRDWGEFVEKITINPEERLQLIRQSESKVLPGCVRESVKSGFDPIVSVLFAAGGTEARFTGMRGLDLAQTFWADKDMPAKQSCPARKHFKNVDNNGLTDQLAVGEKKFPPVAVINENISDFDMTADEFHEGNIVKLTVDKRKSRHEVKRRA
jgi:hypothetical protein